MHSPIHQARSDADQLPLDTDWRRYVPAPAAARVSPVAVLTIEGDVTGAEEFLAGTGPLTLRSTLDGTPAAIVLDYGRSVAGRPWLEVVAADAAASLRVSYSEAAHWSGANGDERGGHNASANRSRVETFGVTGPALFASELIQGGQRYQRITLETPGTVAIGSVGFDFAAFRATAEAYAGHFVCSDDELNRIWYESAYTTQLNQLPADSLPVAWSVDEEGLRVKGGTLAVLRGGSDWTDLTAEFETRVVANAAGWLVRADGDGARGYLFELRATAEGEASILRCSAIDDGYEDRPQDTVRRYRELGSVELAPDFAPAAWHRIRTVVAGSSAQVSIDGDLVAQVSLAGSSDDSTIERGSFGFHEAWDTSKVPGEEARFRDLVVTAVDGTELFRDALDRADVLDAFVGDGVVSPDPLPVILDGARRDRSVWSGDLIVQIPNVFYTTAAAEYVSGSVAYLNSFQEPDGRLPARMPPLFPPAIPPQHGQVYSAVYSMHQITNVALHHRYTGDVEFVRSQWSAIRAQLAYDADRVDERDLYVTGDEDGLDWDWYDGPKIGAVTAYNVVYVHVLREAAELAAALGETAAAAAYAERAARGHAAINTHLFDPIRGLYALSDQRRDAVAQDANALAVVHGIAPASEAARILAALDEALPQTPYGPQPFNVAAGFRENVSPYTSGFHLDALFAAGSTERAFELLHELWGHMAAPGPYAAGTVWELLNTDGTPGFGSTTSLAHGWACAPTVALSSAVLGITAQSTAFRTWRIAPQTGSLAWARGAVPTPSGPIELEWRREGASLVVEFVAPAGTVGTVAVPVPSGAIARLSGTTAAGDAVDLILTALPGAGSVAFENIDGGRYTVEY